MNKVNLVIIGGGNLGHAIIGKVSLIEEVNVSMLSSKPERWNKEIEIIENDGSSSHVKIGNVSDKADEIIGEADIVLLTTPSFLIPRKLKEIKPYLKKNTWVGSLQCAGGFFWMANDILPSEIKLFGFQRVPYISRTIEYGKSVHLKGYKDEIRVAVFGKPEGTSDFVVLLEKLFKTPVCLLNSYLEATLTNSNPILHPSRLYNLFKDWTASISYEEEPLFYEDWNDETSEILIKCDQELGKVVGKLSHKMDFIPTILEHYEVTDKFTLTHKIRSIEAFKNIRLSMRINEENKYVPDFLNRYFTEDIPYGLLVIRGIADMLNVETPMISTIISWAQVKMNKEYLVNNRLSGRDLQETGIPQNFNGQL